MMSHLRSTDCEMDAIPSSVSKMEYRKHILLIDEHLKSRDLECVKFLCQDLVPVSVLESSQRGLDLFQALEKRKRIGANSSLELVAELMYRIGRNDLLKKIGYSPKQVDVRKFNNLPAFRVMLYEICEEIDARTFSELKYFSSEKLGANKIDNIRSTEDLFIALEQSDLLSDDNLDYLRHLLDCINRVDLAEKLQTSPGTRIPSKGPPLVEDSHVSDGTDQQTTEKKLVPPITDMNEWNRRVQDMFIREKALLKEKDLESPVTNSNFRQPEENPEERSMSNINQTAVPGFNERSHTCVGHGEKHPPSTLTKGFQSNPSGPYQGVDFKTAQLRENVQVNQRARRAPVGTHSPVPGQYHSTLVEDSRPAVYIPHQDPVQNVEQYQPNLSPIQTPSPSIQAREFYAGGPRQEYSNKHLPHGPPCYKMDARPRGICLIINNKKFIKVEDDPESRKLPERVGSEIDTGNLHYIFEKLGFDVIMYTDLKKKQMIDLMHYFALKKDHSKFDCFVCCVLSHGTSGSVYAADGMEVAIRELTQPLKSVICQGLLGKPKLFFIQACQGKEKQPGIRGGDIESDAPSVNSEVDSASMIPIPTETIPNEADFLIGYATVPGFVSFRSRSQGSWYITKLTEMLDKYAHQYDLLSILIMVNDEVSKGIAPMSEATYKQSPAPLVTLRKKIYFT